MKVKDPAYFCLLTSSPWPSHVFIQQSTFLLTKCWPKVLKLHLHHFYFLQLRLDSHKFILSSFWWPPFIFSPVQASSGSLRRAATCFTIGKELWCVERPLDVLSCTERRGRWWQRRMAEEIFTLEASKAYLSTDVRAALTWWNTTVFFPVTHSQQEKGSPHIPALHPHPCGAGTLDASIAPLALVRICFNETNPWQLSSIPLAL